MGVSTTDGAVMVGECMPGLWVRYRECGGYGNNTVLLPYRKRNNTLAGRPCYYYFYKNPENMARQAGERFITGMYDDLCFYKMEGKYYVRMGSSLTGKRVKRDPKFKRTMQLAAIFGIANKITSKVYRLLPREERGKRCTV